MSMESFKKQLYTQDRVKRIMDLFAHLMVNIWELKYLLAKVEFPYKIVYSDNVSLPKRFPIIFECRICRKLKDAFDRVVCF